MFHRHRRELELLDARLDAARARLALSRARLHRAGHDALGSRLALLVPFTAGALTGAAVQHREPRRGGRFSAKELLAAVTAVVGLVEVVRDEALPLLAGLRGGAEEKADETAEDADQPGEGRPAGTRAVRHDGGAHGAPHVPGPAESDRGTKPDLASASSVGAPSEPPWPQRIPARPRA